jgi:hypothetical protein
MKLHFQSLGLDLHGEGPNVFAALSQIEEKLKVHTGEGEVLADLSDINWHDMIYYNSIETDWFDSEENFTIKVVEE